MNTLEAVNQMLMSIGQTPVSTVVDNQHPDVISALAVLHRVDKKLQTKGYWFNSDNNLTLAFNPTTLEVIIPSTTLSIDPVDANLSYVQRGNRLYDSYNSTFEIGTSVVVKLIQQISFDELPEVMSNYIAISASYEFVRDKVGDNIKMTELKNDREYARREVNAEDIKNSNISLKNNPSVASMLANTRPSV